MKRVQSIDLMKYVCSIMIIGIHTLDTSSGKVVFLLKLICRIAVPFFAVSTGYLMSEKINSHDWEGIAHYSFRMLILHTFWSLIYFPLNIDYIFYDGMSIYGKIVTFSKRYWFGMDWQLWYIPALVVAIVIITALNRYMKQKTVLFITSIAYAIVLCGDSYYAFFHISISFARTFMVLMLYLQIGCCLKGCENRFSNISYSVLLLLMFIAENTALEYFDIAKDHNTSIILPILIIAVFSCVVSSDIHVKNGKDFGSMSLDIFLMHMIFRHVYVYLFNVSGKYSMFLFVSICSSVASLIVLRFKKRLKFLKYIM